MLCLQTLLRARDHRSARQSLNSSNGYVRLDEWWPLNLLVDTRNIARHHKFGNVNVVADSFTWQFIV